ncbi:hypothetical protein [Mumia zhuanghuii]|uniref:Uncharacterized protein n=1 Tax=Mumia zhuanghuii TaxID=2585211 RepID=A0A5C4MTI7_9ACTN|nr:hypothetical protein [Mumia zhuanghuii]TNC43564.1 hypothetical protein FHE65_18030 [Mumia zhuanghuii]TNC48655.1 hypothetical protein FHE65_07065 [Mumia zhuanghuii]
MTDIGQVRSGVTCGEGTQTYQVLVDRPDLTADGVVRVRFQDTGADYDPSIADVWTLATLCAPASHPLRTREIRGCGGRMRTDLFTT